MPLNINTSVVATIQVQDATLPNGGINNPLFNRNLNQIFNGNDYQIQKLTLAATTIIPQSGTAFCGLIYIRNLSSSQTLQINLSSSVSNVISIPAPPGAVFIYSSVVNQVVVWPFQIQLLAYAGSAFPIDIEYALAATGNV